MWDGCESRYIEMGAVVTLIRIFVYLGRVESRCCWENEQHVQHGRIGYVGKR
jgi:hypothetical protein